MPDTAIDFVLSALDQNLLMDVMAILPLGELPEEMSGHHATATYEVSVAAMKDAFYFQSDSKDIDDEAPADTKYYVDWPDAYVLNPSHAFVKVNPIATTDSDGAIPDDRTLVKHDFIRHVAKTLFNTHLAVDMFSNEQALKDDLAAKGATAWAAIKVKLDTAKVAMTNADNTTDNLCRVLFQNILKNDAQRFTSLTGGLTALLKGGATDEVTTLFSIPFVAGDSISFKATLKPEGTQHSIITGAEPVPDRVYAIKINIVATPVNIEVTDAAALNASRVVTV
jgi:hypothetical protein